MKEELLKLQERCAEIGMGVDVAPSDDESICFEISVWKIIKGKQTAEVLFEVDWNKYGPSSVDVLFAYIKGYSDGVTYGKLVPDLEDLLSQT